MVVQTCRRQTQCSGDEDGAGNGSIKWGNAFVRCLAPSRDRKREARLNALSSILFRRTCSQTAGYNVPFKRSHISVLSTVGRAVAFKRCHFDSEVPLASKRGAAPSR